MASPLEIARQRQADPWLVGSSQFNCLLAQRQSELTPYQRGNLPRILLTEADPVCFLAGFLAACGAECPVFLGNPNWQNDEWQQVLPLIRPNLIWGTLPVATIASSQMLTSPDPTNPAQPGWIMIPTGGSSGQIKFAIHTWQTLQASVQACQQYFQITQINSVCVLPLYHVSGLMQWLRSFTTGGQLVIAPFSELSDRLATGSALAGNLRLENFWLSLVPTQLQRLLQIPAAIAELARFELVLLGGAPAGAELLAQARQHQIRLSPTYGMTETASQIATLKPEAFLAGMAGCGQVLPHAQLQLLNPEGATLGSNQIGQIQIQATSLALGYYPQVFTEPTFTTDDLGLIDDEGNLQLVGRSSQKIITGGENVFPSEVEAAILATGLVEDVCVIGLPDREWGEVVTAIYVPIGSAFASHLSSALQDRLSKFKQPKRWLAIAQIPRNPQGKVNYSQLKTWAASQRAD
ncbi:MAG: 2-succinylbenzoate--CoA ligase [Aphanocapsa sp. GSE-SYN-MK-11-07L]|jgi:O-succinylbenzoic acid--CoA ligase|nr:2-succinylbenzoate--CoA ligase [Aphanocapsa sp. GSE-SYN-MK-11-07L]